jgi:hypothetical protein
VLAFVTGMLIATDNDQKVGDDCGFGKPSRYESSDQAHADDDG